MEDADLEHTYFLHTQTGEVVFLSEYDRSDESEKLVEEIEGNSQYVPIERIPGSSSNGTENAFREKVYDKHEASLGSYKKESEHWGPSAQASSEGMKEESKGDS